MSDTTLETLLKFGSYHDKKDNLSAYLWWLLNKEKMSGKDILQFTFNVHSWLYDNIYDEKSPNMNWTGGTTYIDGLRFYNLIWFRRAEDLVAFKLKFGIGS